MTIEFRGSISEFEQFFAFRDQLDSIDERISLIMAKLEDVNNRLTIIDSNTTASAAAAATIADSLTNLRQQLDQVLTDAGIPADQEDAILKQLDAMASKSTDLRTFLEATAAGPQEPAPVPAELGA